MRKIHGIGITTTETSKIIKIENDDPDKEKEENVPEFRSKRTTCPECDKAISINSLARHRRRVHGVISDRDIEKYNQSAMTSNEIANETSNVEEVDETESVDNEISQLATSIIIEDDETMSETANTPIVELETISDNDYETPPETPAEIKTTMTQEERSAAILDAKTELSKTPEYQEIKSVSHMSCAVQFCPFPVRALKRMFRFPSQKNDKIRYLKWVEAANRLDLPSNPRFCHHHFDENSYERDLQNELLGKPLRRLLKKDALPTLHLPICPLWLRKTEAIPVKLKRKREPKYKYKPKVDGPFPNPLIRNFEFPYAKVGSNKKTKNKVKLKNAAMYDVQDPKIFRSYLPIRKCDKKHQTILVPIKGKFKQIEISTLDLKRKREIESNIQKRKRKKQKISLEDIWDDDIADPSWDPEGTYPEDEEEEEPSEPAPKDDPAAIIWNKEFEKMRQQFKMMEEQLQRERDAVKKLTQEVQTLKSGGQVPPAAPQVILQPADFPASINLPSTPLPQSIIANSTPLQTTMLTNATPIVFSSSTPCKIPIPKSNTAWNPTEFWTKETKKSAQNSPFKSVKKELCCESENCLLHKDLNDDFDNTDVPDTTNNDFSNDGVEPIEEVIVKTEDYNTLTAGENNVEVKTSVNSMHMSFHITEKSGNQSIPNDTLDLKPSKKEQPEHEYVLPNTEAPPGFIRKVFHYDPNKGLVEIRNAEDAENFKKQLDYHPDSFQTFDDETNIINNEQFYCPTCKHEYGTLNSLKDHMELKHGLDQIDQFICHFCPNIKYMRLNGEYQITKRNTF